MRGACSKCAKAGRGFRPAVLDALLPAALSLQRLHAVTVDKGCYPGQEIVARLHFRGGHKHHLYRVVLSQPIHSGEVLRIDDHDVGYVLDVVSSNDQTEALVVLDDAFASSVGADIAPVLDNHVDDEDRDVVARMNTLC